MQLTRNLEFLEFVISRRTIPKVYFYQNESTNVNSYLRINRKLYCCFIETYTNYFSEIVFIYILSINIYQFRYIVEFCCTSNDKKPLKNKTN